MTNPSAFPAPENFATLGMKLRDYFAAQAMIGIISGIYGQYNETYEPPFSLLAQRAGRIADAMLAEREK